MKEHQSNLMANRSILAKDIHKSSAFAIYSSMKIFSSIMLQVLSLVDGQPERDDRERSEEDLCINEQCLSFISSCMLSCIATACESLVCVTQQTAFPIPTPPSIGDGGSVRDVNVLSCSLLWMACIIHKINLILYQVDSGANPSLESQGRSLRGFLDYFIPRALGIAITCLKTISSCTGVEGSCYRLCLSVLRNIINAFLIRHRRGSIAMPQSTKDSASNAVEKMNADSTDPDLLGDNRDNGDDDLFGGIDDDMLLAIDLDQFVERDDTREAQGDTNFDDVGGQELWDFLLKSLRQAKVSYQCT